jgi:adenosine/AMP kinase
MELQVIEIEKPEESNIILAQSHFIKTVEDVYEVLVSSVPGIKFGLAFNEASGPCLTRFDGNDKRLMDSAVKNAQKIRAGHLLVILIENAYPINTLNALKNVQEITSVYCATANPVKVVVAFEGEGASILGVIDGSSPKGVESQEERTQRHEFLRKIGYKR